MTANERKFYMKGYRRAKRPRKKRPAAHEWRDKRKSALARKFCLTMRQLHKVTQPFLDQLDRCKDDDARAVLLGAVVAVERNRAILETKPVLEPIGAR